MMRLYDGMMSLEKLVFCRIFWAKPMISPFRYLKFMPRA
jgi:hypothetical protein